MDTTRPGLNHKVHWPVNSFVCGRAGLMLEIIRPYRFEKNS